jgi:hypothetical protein
MLLIIHVNKGNKIETPPLICIPPLDILDLEPWPIVVPVLELGPVGPIILPVTGLKFSGPTIKSYTSHAWYPGLQVKTFSY